MSHAPALLVCAAIGASLSAQTVVSTITHVGSFAGGVTFDAVTNEVIVVDSNTNTATYYDRVTGTQVHQIPVQSGALIVGAQIDLSTGHLWVVGEDEIVREYDRAGAQLTSFASQPVITDASAITIDPFTDTIWISNDSGNIVAEFTKAGVYTGTQFVPAGSTDGDGIVYDPYTRTFLMGEDTLNQVIAVDRTGAQVAVFAVGALGLSPEGLAIDPYTGNLFIANGLIAPISVSEVSGILTPRAPGALQNYGSTCGARLAAYDALRDDGVTGSGTWIGYQSAVPGVFPFLFVGSTAPISLPLNGIIPSPCSAYALPDGFSLFGLTNTDGRTGVRLPVPPGLVGAQLNLWCCDFDLFNFAIPSASDGVQLVIQ